MPGSTIDTLIVRIEADVRDLKAKLGVAEKTVSSASRKMMASLRALRTGFLAIGVAAAGLTYGIKRAVAAADNIAKTSRRIGIAAETYQELAYHAEISGVQIEQLNQAITALVRRQGEAINGNKEFAKGFEQIGLTIEDLRNLTPEQLILRVVDGLSKIEKQSLKIAAADRMMSEAGRRVINITNGGADAFERNAEKARELGLVMSTELLKGAEEANDKLTTLAKVLSINMTRAVVELAPEISDLADAIIDAMPTLIRGAKVIANLIAPSAEAKIGAELAEVTAKLGELMEQRNKLRPRAEAEGVGLELMYYKKLGEEIDKLKKRHALLMNQLLDTRSPLPATPVDPVIRPPAETAASGLSEEQVKALKARASEFARAGAAIKSDWVAHLEEMRKINEDFDDSLLDMGRAIRDEMMTPLEAYEAKLEKLGVLLRTGAIDQETYSRAASKAAQELAETNPIISRIGSAFDNLGQRVADFAASGEKKLIDFRDIVTSVLNDIAGAMLQMMIFDPMKKAVMSGLEQLITPRAGGGPVSPGSTYLVGEKGPELFSPRNPGSIIPAGQTAAALAGGGTQIIYNVDARGSERGVGDEIMRALRELSRSIEPRAVAAVRAATVRDPGMFAK